MKARLIGGTRHLIGDRIGWRVRIFMQFVCFASVGVAGTCAHYAVLIGLVEVLSLPAVLGSAAGFIMGAFLNYLLNHRFTFRSRRPHREVAPKFYAVALTGFVLNATMMTLATHMFSMPYLLAQAAATATVLMWNFSANRWWTFKESLDATH